MHRTFLALTLAALASFATAVHADDGAKARSTIVADLQGKGVMGQPCHAVATNLRGGTDYVNIGNYAESFGKLVCRGAGGLSSINCRKDEPDKPPKATCWDGHAKKT